MRYVVDLLVILLVGGNVVLGYRFGVVGRAAAFAGLFGGVALATFAGNSITRFFRGSGTPDDLYAATAIYLSLVALVVVVLEVLAFLYHERMQRVLSLLFDRTTGVLLGGFVGFLEAALVCVVMLAAGHTQPQGGEQLPLDRGKLARAVDGSLIGQQVARSEPFVSTLFRAALPTDLPAHLAEATE
jgi:uncharacterized membrane protein required for colicin V production